MSNEPLLTSVYLYSFWVSLSYCQSELSL